MTNDDKDLKLKKCPFCSGLVKSHIEPTGKLIFICLICEVQWTKCGDISTFNALNARPTPQKPSESKTDLVNRLAEIIYFYDFPKDSDEKWECLSDHRVVKRDYIRKAQFIFSEYFKDKSSEPLKELDEQKVVTMLLKAATDEKARIEFFQKNDYRLSMQVIKSNVGYLANAICSHFGQPSEKKALSVERIEEMLHELFDESCCNGNHDSECSMQDCRSKGFYMEKAQAIFDALPAQREVRYPENRKEK